MRTFLLSHLCLFLLLGCSSLFSRSRTEGIADGEKSYNFQDSSGSYRLIQTTKNMRNQLIYSKTQIMSGEVEEKLLEQSVVVSAPAAMKFNDQQIKVLNPKIAQYTVWLEGKKYFSQMKVDQKRQQLEVISGSPGANDWKKEVIPLAKRSGVYCFYTQLVECIQATGFLDKAKQQGTGTMSLYLIWDGQPFLKEQYANFFDEVVTPANFVYEEATEEGDIRYTLKTERHDIFYDLGPRNELVRKSWVAQGITQEVNELSE